MGVKSKVSVSDLRNAQSKWHLGGRMKGGYDCIASGALICDAGPRLIPNLISLPFKEEFPEQPARSEFLEGRTQKNNTGIREGESLPEYYHRMSKPDKAPKKKARTGIRKSRVGMRVLDNTGT